MNPTHAQYIPGTLRRDLLSSLVAHIPVVNTTDIDLCGDDLVPGKGQIMNNLHVREKGLQSMR